MVTGFGEEYWNVEYKRRFYAGPTDDSPSIQLHIDTCNVPMEKRNQVEAASEAYFDKVREIFST